MAKKENREAHLPTAPIGYEAELWRMADALRGSVDAAEYKHAVPGLIFLKYISDAFDEHGERLEQEPYADLEDLDNHRNQVLFIGAREMGRMVDRTHRELTDEDIQRIANTYHAWRGEKDAGEYADVPGFCKSAALEEIRKHGYVLTPGRYVGAPPQEDDDEPFAEKMARLVAELHAQQAEAARLDEVIWKNLKELGYDR